jgi:hypothetical protein
LFNLVRIKAGYIVKREIGGFYIHTKKKAYIIDKNAILKLKMSEFELTKAFSTNTFNLYIVIGTKNVILIYLSSGVYYLLQQFFKVYKSKYGYVNLLTELNIYNTSKNLISIKLKYAFSFNLLGILSKIIANLIIKGVNNAKKYSKT